MELDYPVAALSSFDTLVSLEPHDLTGLVYSHDLLLTEEPLPEAEKLLR